MPQLKPSPEQQVQVKQKLNLITKALLGTGIFCAVVVLFNFTLLFNAGVVGLNNEFINQYLIRASAAQSYIPSGYFVDINSPNCQDAVSAGTFKNPWCSIQFAVSAQSPVQPGETVYVRKGVYKESVGLGKSGLAGAKITLKKYQNEMAVIDGSVALENWELAEGDVYRKSYNSNPYGLFLDDNLLEKVWPFPETAIVGDLSDYLLTNQYTYNPTSHELYIKLKTSPQNHKIEVPEKSTGISANNQKFWVIDGLKITRFTESGIIANGSGSCEQDYLIIKNNTIGFNEYAGIQVNWCPGVVIENNTIIKNGLVWAKGYYRHQGVKTEEQWGLYLGSNNIYQTVKGSDCNNSLCNAGPELMYYNGNLVAYNYDARTANNPSLLNENEWTTLGPNGEEYPELYFYPPGGINPTGAQVKRAVNVAIMNGNDIGGHGILLNTPASRQGRFAIKNNYILNNNSKGISVCYTSGYCLDSVAGSIIYGNYVYNSGESGVDGLSSRGVTFSYNNLWQNGIRDLEGNGLNGHGDKGLLGTTGWRIHHNIIHGSGLHEYGFGHEDTRFFNNTLVKDATPLDSIIGCANYGGQNAYVKPYVSDNTKIKNSIFVINDQGNHTDQCGYSATIIGTDPSGGNLTDNIDWNGNDYFTIEPIKTHTIGSKCLTADQGSECVSNNFMEAYPNEHRTDGVFDSFAVDPLFVKQEDNNLKLKNDSPLIDQGVPLTTTAGNGNGNTVSILDAQYFHDYDNYPNLPNKEVVKINNQTCTITAVDYLANLITCNETVAYQNGDKVYWNYSGQKPDLGAVEAGLNNPLPTMK